jgi:hypothetical protein
MPGMIGGTPVMSVDMVSMTAMVTMNVSGLSFDGATQQDPRQ